MLRILLGIIGGCGGILMQFPRGSAVFGDERPLSPKVAAERFTLPDGFTCTLFAGEPDVTQPIAFTIDPRGRLWVVECRSYPDWTRDGSGQDRVLIFEDRDGDGQFDERTVFWDRGSNLSGIELGFGGVWLCSTPNLVFLPDRNGDDRPDGPPEPVLDGWDLEARHNVFNGLTWGPDGWLYGCNGILSNSSVGPPGATDEQRTRLNCGVWRYHPVRREFEVVASGTTNPWGLDFDAVGRLFITNCVIEHVFQVFPGAHYQRMFGQDLNTHAYGLIKSCADHIHWGGGFWDIAIGGVHNDYGGGHAHAGAMIYLGDNWPAEYRGHLFTINIHGQRVNRDACTPRGSGVVVSHRPDAVLSRDPWFRGLELKYGPDGGVYVTDWNDIGECHDAEEVQRETGRIFKITHGAQRDSTVDLAALSDVELAERQRHENEWHVRTSRRLLQERSSDRMLDAAAVEALRAMLAGDRAVERLRAVWTLHATGNLDADALRALFADADEHARSWAVRLELEDRSVTRGDLLQLAELAREDASPVVRVELAAALQRLPAADRWPVARELVRHAADAEDHNIPLMLWYGIEPLAGDAESRDMGLLAAARIPLVQRYLARRIATMDGGIERLAAWMRSSDTWVSGTGVAEGLKDAVEGRRQLRRPERWEEIARKPVSDATARDALDYVSLVFGDNVVFERLVATARDTTRAEAERRTALETLIQVPNPQLLPALQALLRDAALAEPALRGLALYDDPSSAPLVVELYPDLTDVQREAAVSLLAARRGSARVLVEALASKRIPARDVSAYVARQLRDYGDPAISGRLDELWGSLRSSPREKTERIAEYGAQLTADALQQADVRHGRGLFVQKCAQCHRLFGEGATIGPELTGAQRTSVEYLLQHIVEPSAAVPREYRVHTVLTSDGRLLNGVVPEEGERTVTLQTPTERIVLDRADIEEMRATSASMMPEGLLEALSPEERRDLVAYLAAPAQVALPEAAGR
jgi:putative membrane-bound dehydrogenase-like protein